MQITLTDYSKLYISARYWLLGMAEHDPRYFEVLDAMDWAKTHHNGLRNGGQPAFIHQLGIFHRMRTLRNHLKNPHIVLMLVFLHDIIEDATTVEEHGVKVKKYISPEEVKARYGELIMLKVLKLSKEIQGQPNPNYSLKAVFEDEDCGPAKLGDRDNNVSTMVGVFKPKRLEKYVLETADDFLPLAKMARHMYPHQEAVYENLKLSIINQLQLIVYIMDRLPAEPETA